MYLTAGGDPVKPIRVLRTTEEWTAFFRIRAQAKVLDYDTWSKWARMQSYAMNAKVAKQVGLQTPGKGKPSPLFYERLRAANGNGELTLECDNGTRTGRMSSTVPNFCAMPRELVDDDNRDYNKMQVLVLSDYHPLDLAGLRRKS